MTDNFDEKVDKIIDRLVQKIETMISTKADRTIIESKITQSVGELRDELVQKESYINSRLDVLNQRIIALENSTPTRAAQAPAPVPAPVPAPAQKPTLPVDLSTVIGLASNGLYYEWVQKILEKITSNEALKNELNVKIPECIKNLKNQPLLVFFK